MSRRRPVSRAKLGAKAQETLGYLQRAREQYLELKEVIDWQVDPEADWLTRRRQRREERRFNKGLEHINAAEAVILAAHPELIPIAVEATIEPEQPPAPETPAES